MSLRAIRKIKNPNAVVRLVRNEKWPTLPDPIYGMDNFNKARAVSALRGIPTRDGEPVHPSDLTDHQARDVARWVRH